MMKSLILKIILGILDQARAYAATTPDPLDDMLISVLRSFVEKLLKANSHADIVAATDHAKAQFNQAFPQP